MNLKNLNIGIANLVESNGRLELELNDSKEKEKLYRDWWEKTNVENLDTKEKLINAEDDLTRANEQKEELIIRVNEVIEHLRSAYKGKDDKVGVDYIINKLENHVKKDA